MVSLFNELSFVEADKFLFVEIKTKVSEEYFRELRKILKSKLNGGYLVHGVNTWPVSLLKHSAAFFS